MNEIGAASVEYIVLLSLVSVGSAVAVMRLGPLLVAQLQFVRAWLLMPFA